MAPKYLVFIGHAGEDKHSLAMPVYNSLKKMGVSTFLDERELRVAGDAIMDMDEAMQTAVIGLFILSPEFALKEYPMFELRCFMRRAGMLGGASSADPPLLVPVFYRLSVAECKYAKAFEATECDPNVRRRFDERAERGETSIEEVLEHLRLLTRRTGIENKMGIGNDDTVKDLREMFAKEIRDNVMELLENRVGGMKLACMMLTKRMKKGFEQFVEEVVLPKVADTADLLAQSDSESDTKR